MACDKCGKSVPNTNNAVFLEELVTGSFAGLVSYRHLYPTGKCEGSPSRVRMIETNEQWAKAYKRLVNGELPEWVK